MRIYDRSLTGEGLAEAGKAQEAQKLEPGRTAKPVETSAGSGDRVELSGALGRLSQALEAFGSGRASRVQELTALYRSGGYQPDSAATSRAIVSEALAAGGE